MQLFFPAENFKKLRNVFFVIFFVLEFLFSVCIANAATLSILPGTSTVAAGNIITLNVVVNSEGQAINNSDAVIQFPTDLLKVISVSKSSSIFSLWVQDPSFSNTTGQISFNGGIINPGYTGSNGNLISITFQAKKTGTASVLFSDASVRANDGLGTEVLTAKNGGTLNINAPALTPVAPSKPLPLSSTPSSSASTNLIISSATHPDQNAWYNVNDAVLAWKLPNGVKTVETSLDSDPNGLPQVSHTPAISSQEIPNIADGISYFHVRYLTSSGWSPVSNYKLQIDTMLPQDLVVNTSPNQNNQLSVQMSASDSLSGIGHYTLQVDNGPSITALPDPTTGNATLTLEATPGMSHVLTVVVFDRAGNMVQSVSAVNATEASTSANKAPSTTQKQLLIQIGSYTTQLLSVLIPLVALLILLLLLMYYAWHKLFRMRSRLRKDLEQSHLRIHQAFKTLSEEMAVQLAIIEKSSKNRELSLTEKKAVEDLRTAIKQVDEYTQKLVQKIEDTDL